MSNITFTAYLPTILLGSYGESLVPPFRQFFKDKFANKLPDCSLVVVEAQAPWDTSAEQVWSSTPIQWESTTLVPSSHVSPDTDYGKLAIFQALCSQSLNPWTMLVQQTFNI